MAIVAVLGGEGRQQSRFAIPVDGGADVGRRVVLAHQVRTLYVPGRFYVPVLGRVSATDLYAVGAAFLNMILWLL